MYPMNQYIYPLVILIHAFSIIMVSNIVYHYNNLQQQMLRENKLSINRTYRQTKKTSVNFIHLLKMNKQPQHYRPEYRSDCTEQHSKSHHEQFPLRERLDHQNTNNNRQVQPNQDGYKDFQAFSFENVQKNVLAKDKEKAKLYVKISELIKNQELNISKNNDTGNMTHNLLRRERPYTSLSQKRYVPDRKSLGRYSYVLCIPPKQEQQPEPEKISTSRALIQYSKVYKNLSNQKVRRIKEKRLFSNFLQLSTHKMVFSEKQKQEKQKMNVTCFIKSGLIREGFSKKKTEKNRYEQDVQSFEIGGWDYFQ